MYQALIPIIVPVLAAVLIGYGWSRTRVAFERDFLTVLVMNIGVPCLILQGMTTLHAGTPAFALGHALGTLGVRNLPRAIGVAALRLGSGVAIGWAIVTLLDLSGTLRGVVLIQCAMLVAVFNYLFAARYDRHPAEVAGAIVVSTLVSLATLPILLIWALPG